MPCPNCGSTDCREDWNKSRHEGVYKDIEFRDVALFCKSCKYQWNCKGSKQINTSVSPL